ncbi:MAG: branched-chain amino acid ABC transporter permease [Candidatus Competibacterales bacterium]
MSSPDVVPPPAVSPPGASRLRPVIPGAIFALFALLPLGLAEGQGYLLSLFTGIMIFALAAMSLDFILGYGALVSFGHAAFVGVGAYGVGILAHHGIETAAIALPVAVGGAALVALAIGAMALRTRGIYFIMITLAFAQMLYYTTTSLEAYGGDDGLVLWGRTQTFGLGLFDHRLGFYYAVLACLVGCYLALRAVVGSRFGRVFQGCRENEARVAALGFDPYRYRLTAFVIAGAVAGLAGALLANHTEFVSPSYLSWHRSADLIIMVVLGGAGSLHGALYGALLFLGLEALLPVALGEWLPGLGLGEAATAWLEPIADNWKVLLGPVLVLVALYARGGLVHGIERWLGPRIQPPAGRP